MSSEVWDGHTFIAKRRGSIGSIDDAHAADDKNDDDLAEEIDDLKRRGVLPFDFPSAKKDGLSKDYGDSDTIELGSDFETSVYQSAESYNECKTVDKSGQPNKPTSKNVEETVETPCLYLAIPSLLPNGLPSNWSALTTRGSYQLESLHRGEEEYDVVEDEFQNIGMKVTKIKRLQNKRLLERFKAEIEDVRRHISEDDDVTVKYLYHGTSADKAKLCEEGLDQRLSRMGYFGKGIYFSDTPLKCVHYADDPGRSNPDEAYILKCRVILGDVKVYPHGTNDISLKREPEKEDTYSGWRYYDSVKGCPKDFNEYVVYESRRALIEYIITFQVNKDLVAKLRSKSLKTSSKPVCAAPSTPAKQSVIFRTNQSVIPSTQSRMTAGQNAEHNFHTNHLERNLTDRIPRYGQMPNTPDTEHSRRIQEVRETVRLKRSIESTNRTGLQVQAESASQQQQQQLQQQLWPVDDVDSEMNDLLTRPLSRSEVSLKSQSSHAEDFDGPPAPPRQRDPKTQDEARSVEQVLDLCIHEFMNVTNMEDSNRARYFVQRADMDVNKAISLYYEEM